jgi:acetyl esterase/lipase
MSLPRAAYSRQRSVAGAIVLALLAVLFGGGSVRAQARTADGIVVIHDLAYGPLVDQRLDICKPAYAARSIPGVILIHGGGWAGGDKESLMRVCKPLAREGILAATINYRLMRRGTPATLWPAQLVDAQLAVRWLRVKAPEIGLDKTRLCAYGESAGAHLAVFLAVKKTIEAGDESRLYPRESPAVLCAVDNFGPVDLTNPGVLVPAAELLVGLPLTRGNLSAFIAASPLLQVSKDTAPMFVEQGSSDRLVDPLQSRRLVHALRHYGVAVHFVSYPGGHSWEGLNAADRDVYFTQERLYLLRALRGR